MLKHKYILNHTLVFEARVMISLNVSFNNFLSKEELSEDG